jgi:pimeloyl-ACP methyl ester carboxylesterase
MPIIKTRDGTGLYVKDWGAGRPVVLIHGWSFSADFWDYQSLALAEAGCRAISYDRRGFGRSDQPWRGYDYDTFADDLADVMETMGLDGGVALVGYSMGSGEVARYMSRHNGRGVAQAVLVGPVVPMLLRAPDNPHGYDPGNFDKQSAKTRDDRAAFFRSYHKSMFGVGMISHPVSEATVDWTWRMAMQAGLHPLLAAREAFGRTDFRPDLPAFTVPTLVIHGTSDSDAPIDATGRAAAAGIAGARLIEYEDARHGLVITHKERLSQDLLAFLSDAGDA